MRASAIAAPNVSGSREDSTGKAQVSGNFALLIGISNYKHLAPLATPEKDVEAIAKVLHEQYGFTTKVLLNPTRADIMGVFGFYRKTLSKDSKLLIFYAGHGFLDTEVDEAYWLPLDARSDTNSNWISADDITRAVRGIASRHVLVISDSCYSGAILDDEAGQRAIRGLRVNEGLPTEETELIEKLDQRASRNLMTSGSKEPVADAGAPGHSIFADALVRGLNEMPSLKFAASDVFYLFVKRKVGGNSQQLPQYGILRNSGDELGDFVFTRAGESASKWKLELASRNESRPGTSTEQRPETEEQRQQRLEIEKGYREQLENAVSAFEAVQQRYKAGTEKVGDVISAHEKVVQSELNVCSTLTEKNCRIRVYEDAYQVAQKLTDFIRQQVAQGIQDPSAVSQAHLHESELRNLLLQEHTQPK